jgi:hypothetical protein
MNSPSTNSRSRRLRRRAERPNRFPARRARCNPAIIRSRTRAPIKLCNRGEHVQLRSSRRRAGSMLSWRLTNPTPSAALRQPQRFARAGVVDAERSPAVDGAGDVIVFSSTQPVDDAMSQRISTSSRLRHRVNTS